MNASYCSAVRYLPNFKLLKSLLSAYIVCLENASPVTTEKVNLTRTILRQFDMTSQSYKDCNVIWEHMVN